MRRILTCVKTSVFIPPVLALAVAIAWNVHQMRSISSLDHESGELRAKINASVKLSPVRIKNDSKNLQANIQEAIDWKQVSAKLSDGTSGGEAMRLREMMNLKQRLKGMSREELVTALDEIDALGLSDDERESMMGMILESLTKLDPQYTLARFVDQIASDSNGVGWYMADAFKQWQRKDFKAATAWYDSQIAAGKFDSKSLDGRSDIRTQFESAVLEELLSSDLDAAGRRLLALPEDQRREVLEEMSFPDLTADERKAYASLVRQLIPADERAGSFAHIAEQLVSDGDFEQVAAFLDSVQASPEERAVSAKQAAISQMESLGMESEITKSSVDELRTWLDKQAPGQTDSITGKSLAEAAQSGGTFDYDAASQLVLQYHQSTGRDDVLIAFLEGYSAHSNLEEARTLADLIADPKQRESILEQLK